MSIRRRLYPDPAQSPGLVEHCHQARFVFNIGLEQRSMWRRDRHNRGTHPQYGNLDAARVSTATQMRELAQLRQCLDWLRAGSSSVQQAALRDLDRAFANFFAGRAKYPSFKRRSEGEGSFVVRDLTRSTQKEKHTMRTTLGGVALLLTIATTATACGGSSDNTRPPATKSPTPTRSSPAPSDPRDQAKADAVVTLKRYFAVGDQVGRNPKVPLSKLKSVETSTLLFAERHQFERWRSSGWKQVGTLKVTKMQVQAVSLDNSDPAKGKAPYVTVMVCTDASNVDVVDQSGKSVVLSTRPRYLTTLYTIANYHWKTDPSAGWRVATGTDKEVGKCTL